MDINDLRSAVTVLGLLGFIAIALWTWRSERRAAFEDAAALPFTGDGTHRGDEQ